METKRFTLVALAVGLLMCSADSLWAHHGFAAFYTTERVTLKGTVTSWRWANPHCLLLFDVKDDKGNIVHWAAEVENPNSMANRGWARNSFAAGDEVAVSLEPARSGNPVGRIFNVVLPNGKVLVGMEGTGVLSPTENLQPKS